MRRRDLVAGIATAADPQGQLETLYIPARHRVEDLALLHETMEEYSFAGIVTATPSLRITHVPVWLERKAGPYGTLYGHIARSNPQSAAIESRTPAVAVFRGPHAYISPSWYENPNAVPTWNFAVVHATGNLEAVTDEKALYGLLSTLVEKSERKYGAGRYDFSSVPRSYTDSLIKGIVGFRLRIETIEGKFKLGQERSEGDQERTLRNLKTAPSARSMADFTADFYRRRPKRQPVDRP